MLGEPIIWGSVAVVLTLALIVLLKVTFWPKPDFRPSRMRNEHGSLPERLQEITRHRAERLLSMPVAEALRMDADQLEYGITRSGRKITMRTRRTVLPDGRIRVWVETADERWYSSALPASEVIFLQQSVASKEPGSSDPLASKK